MKLYIYTYFLNKPIIKKIYNKNIIFNFYIIKHIYFFIKINKFFNANNIKINVIY